MNHQRKTSSRHHLNRIQILHEDRDLLVVCKGPGLLTTSYKGDKNPTAVVHGRLDEKSGKFAGYLAENDDQVVYSTSDAAKGKWSETLFQVVKETPRFSLLDITLLTGRKNQIRVHLAEAGHPVVGDPKYGTKRDRVPRMALHARTLAFPHPHDGRRMEFEAPVPEVIQGLVDDP